MEGLIVIGIIIALFVFLYARINKRKFSLNMLFYEASRLVNFKYKRGFSPSISGSIDNKEISVRKSPNNTGLVIFLKHTISVKGFLNISKNIVIEPISTSIWKVINIKTGDDSFDRQLKISASEEYYISALMNSSIREKLYEFSGISSRFEISNSWIRAASLNFLHKNPKVLAESIKIVAWISNNLTDTKDIKTRLVENVLKDPIGSVRLKNLQHLITHFPIDQEIEETLHSGLNDEDIQVQVEAAKHLKDKGMKHLLSILESHEVIHLTIVMDIVNFFRLKKYSISIPVFIKLYQFYKNMNLHIAILQAFEEFADESISPFLIKILDDNDNDIRLQVVNSLGTCGTVAAVEHLFLSGKNSLNPFFRSAVQKSIAQIQSRLGGVDKGWLSVAELSDKDGALSVVDGVDDGALSIEDDDNNILKK